MSANVSNTGPVLLWMVSAYDDVFTFHPNELNRFRQLLAEMFTR